MRWLIVGCSALVAGCASRPPALREIDVRVERAPEGAPSADEAIVITIEGAGVERLPASGAAPILSSATLITNAYNEPMAVLDGEVDALLIADPLLWPGGEASEAFGRVGPAVTRRALVPVGCVGEIDLSGASAPPLVGEEQPGVTLIVVPRPGGGVPDFEIRAKATAEDEMFADAQPPLRVARVPWPLGGAEGEFLLALRPRAGGRGSGAAPTIWRVRAVMASGDPASMEEAERMIAEAAAASPQAGRWAAGAAALRVDDPAEARRALGLAALDVGAEICGEAAAVATDAEVPVIAAEVASALAGLGPDTAPERAAWAVERGVLIAMGKLRSEDRLSRGLAGMVSARFGEAGREPALVADLAEASGSADVFAERLVGEHLLFLGDLSPASRVRAYDWLRARGAAPEGYDPLGPEKERRAAIDAHLENGQVRP